MFARTTPSAAGVDASGLLAFLDAVAAGGLELHSVMIARHGDVVAEGWWAPYGPDRVHLCYSLSKTLTATAVATLASEGTIDIDAPVLSYLPELDLASVSERWRAVTVAHCLSMSVGHTADAGSVLVDPADWSPAADPLGPLRRIVATELDAEPGTLFVYNQVATYLLSHVVRRVAGQPLAEVVRARFLDRLGATELPWHTDPFGVELGFSGAHLRTETILAMAQLGLDRGRWGDEQLVADWWYDRATVPGAPVRPDPAGSPDWNCGYGFSYWMQRHGFRGDGAYGQYMISLPEQSLAIAITGEIAEMQSVIDAIWEHVLPAVDRPGDPAADAELAARLAGAQFAALGGGAAHVPGGRCELPRGDARIGDGGVAPGMCFDLPDDYDAVAIEPAPGGTTVTLRRNGEWTDPIAVGDGEWRESQLTASGRRLPLVASGGWTAPDRYVAEVRPIETPHRFTVTATLDDAGRGSADLTWRYPLLMGPEPMHSAIRPA